MKVVDVTSHLLAWGMAFLVVGPIVLPDRSTGSEIALVLGLTFVGWCYGWYSGLYAGTVGRERTDAASKTIRVLVAVTLVAALAGVVFNLAAKELAVGIAIVWIATILGRALVGAAVRIQRTSGKNRDRILVVGANRDARRFIEVLRLYPELGLDPVGVCGNPAEASIEGLEDLYCGPLRNVAASVRSLDAGLAVIVTGAIPRGQVQEVLDLLKGSDVEVMLSAELGLLRQRRLHSQPIGTAPLFRVGDDSSRIVRLWLKRMIDIVGAGVLLLTTLPLQLLAAAAIKITDPGPVLYLQRRIGANGEAFNMLRFRTMTDGAQHPAERGGCIDLWNDPRMTRVGRILEVTSFNGIPELWNVLRGDMSFVGPKPGYPALDADARTVDMSPGLTGLWRTEANLYPACDARHQVDDIYLENWSMSLDASIFVSSIEAAIVRFLRGASWRHTVDRSNVPIRAQDQLVPSLTDDTSG